MKPTFRLTFIDVIRAFAICMMLQGHFIDGLLANTYRDTSNLLFNIWFYFRGITAPVFFTVSGFIFMYLLAKEKETHKTGWNHIRVRKGIKRGVVLIITAYLLRLNLFNLFSDFKDMNVRMVDVLQCIGSSLLFLISIYLFSYKREKWIMPTILLTTTLILFTFAPIYNKLNYNYLPIELANYFTKANGSVFTLFPWFGYTAFGAFMGVMFNLFKEKKHIYTYGILISGVLGLLLIFASPLFFRMIYEYTGIQVTYYLSSFENSLYQRLGNVLLIFTFFMLMRNVITSKKIQEVGQNTLSIYIIHYIILYGSFTGYGIYRFFHNKLSPYIAGIGAFIFIIIVLYFSFLYNRKKVFLEEKFDIIKDFLKIFLIEFYHFCLKIIYKIKNIIAILFNKSNG